MDTVSTSGTNITWQGADGTTFGLNTGNPNWAFREADDNSGIYEYYAGEATNGAGNARSTYLTWEQAQAIATGAPQGATNNEDAAPSGGLNLASTQAASGDLSLAEQQANFQQTLNSQDPLTPYLQWRQQSAGFNVPTTTDLLTGNPDYDSANLAFIGLTNPNALLTTRPVTNGELVDKISASAIVLGGPIVGDGTFLSDFALDTAGTAPRVTGPAAEGATGTVWDAITATQEPYAGTVLPKSFTLSTSGADVWVAPNASEHIADYVLGTSENAGGLNALGSQELVNLGTQAQLTSLQAAVGAATSNGVSYGTLITQDGWELVFSAPRQSGQLPALIHALPLK